MTEGNQSCYPESDSVAVAKVRKRPLEEDKTVEEIHAKYDRLVVVMHRLSLSTINWG